MKKITENQGKLNHENLERHLKRISWLESENPKWPDGTPVSLNDKKSLLWKSRNFLSCKGN